METSEAVIPYLSGSIMMFLLCLLWVTGLLDVRNQMRKGIFSPTVLVLVAVGISILAVCLIVTVNAVFIDRSSGTHSSWIDWVNTLGI
jgi:hypothetical protein